MLREEPGSGILEIIDRLVFIHEIHFIACQESGDNYQDLAFSLHQEGPRIKLQPAVGGKPIYPLSHPPKARPALELVPMLGTVLTEPKHSSSCR